MSIAHSHIMIDLSGPRLMSDELDLLQNFDVGGICLFRRNIIDKVQITELCEELRSICGEDIVIATDQEGGSVVRAIAVPHASGNMALGAIDDLDVSKKAGQLTARGLRDLGINVNFAPVADVNNNPLNPVIGDRSFGANANRVADHVAAFVEGLQQEGVAATLKHFPGHGDTATDSHLELPRLEASLDRLQKVELLPFERGIQAGAACVMSYHGLIPVLDKDYPGTLSKKVMTSLLRETLGFEGVCFTDALEMKAIAQRYSIAEAAILALNAGNDMVLYDVHESGVHQQEAVFKAIDNALDDGLLDSQALATSKLRLKHLVEQFPSKPHQSSPIWQLGDQGFMDYCDQQAVTVVGQFETLSKGQAVTIVADVGEVGGGASDVVASPVNDFANTLRSYGFVVEVCFYSLDKLENGWELNKPNNNNNKAILFITSSRTRPNSREIELAKQLQTTTKQFIHIALWNPYAIQDIASPAIVSFGFSAPALDKVATVLQGDIATGTLPF